MGVAAFGGIIMAAIVSQSHAMPQPNGFFAWIRACFVVSAEPEEIRQARKLIAAIDRGGLPLNAARVNAIARALGLEVSRQAVLADTVERIRAALARHGRHSG